MEFFLFLRNFLNFYAFYLNLNIKISFYMHNDVVNDIESTLSC